ncbi:MAG: protoporphyrinogen/coproporphyrinogen oxidase [Bdellovibrionota bacterium]
MAEIQVVGAGFSGLSAAYFLMCAGHRVRVVETAPRIGGLIDTLQTPYGPVETAANAMIANAVVERTAADLGVKLTPSLKSARRRYILRDKRLRRWPLRPTASLRLLGMALPLRLGRSSPLAPRPFESVRAWGERALGREATNYLLNPALAGIYAGDPEQLSATLTVGKFFRPRRERRLERGKLRGSVAPFHGMGAWAPAFRRVLALNHCVFSSEALPGLPTLVALPPPAAIKFLAGRAPALEAELRKIRMLPIVSVTIFFPPETAGIPGFGCLFPSKEGFRVLGVLANDRVFPGRARDSISETWLLGGANDAGIIEMSDDQLLQLVLAERAKLHGLKPRVLLSRVTRWNSAIPHYDLALEGALENLRALRFREGHFRLFGNYLGEMGLGSILQRASELPGVFP